MFESIVQEYKTLLRSIPSATVTFFAVSVVVMNLLANKELISLPWLAIDCGTCVSWVSFLCMDVICKRFGARASIEVSVLALAINLAACAVFWLMSLTPGMWGAYYDTGSIQVNDALNATFGGSWYVVMGSSVAMLCSSVVNSLLNVAIGRRMRRDGFASFAARSYGSTFIGQFVDNFVFALIVSHVLFGWSMLQVVTCALTGAVFELLCEVVFSPVGYRVARGWERERVGEEYLALKPQGARAAAEG